MSTRVNVSTKLKKTKTSKGLLKTIWRVRHAYLFIAPIFLCLFLFKYYPFYIALIKSFYEWNGANIDNFVGIKNYILLFQDELFHQSLKNILILTIGGVSASLTLPLLAAVLVFRLRSKKLQNYLRIWFMIPMVVPGVVVIYIWSWIYSGNDGLLNNFLMLIGMENLTHSWLGETGTAIWALIFYNFPWVGASVVFLIYLAGLISIPEELFEAGKMDGMNAWNRFFRLELPMIRSQIKLVLMISIIQQTQNFELPLIMTDGGPGNATLTPALHLYKKAFTHNEMGYASSIGVVLFLIILILTLINFKYFKSTEKMN
jgi:ABC-type sugar transport system permease subunit